jgi:hypothetical protein
MDVMIVGAALRGRPIVIASLAVREARGQREVPWSATLQFLPEELITSL